MRIADPAVMNDIVKTLTLGLDVYYPKLDILTAYWRPTFQMITLGETTSMGYSGTLHLHIHSTAVTVIETACVKYNTQTRLWRK